MIGDLYLSHMSISVVHQPVPAERKKSQALQSAHVWKLYMVDGAAFTSYYLLMLKIPPKKCNKMNYYRTVLCTFVSYVMLYKLYINVINY